MSERRSRAVAERERAQQELEEEQKGEEDYEEMLRQEAQRMNIGGYAPRVSIDSYSNPIMSQDLLLFRSMILLYFLQVTL